MSHSTLPEGTGAHEAATVSMALCQTPALAAVEEYGQDDSLEDSTLSREVHRRAREQALAQRAKRLAHRADAAIYSAAITTVTSHSVAQIRELADDHQRRTICDCKSSWLLHAC